MSTAYQTFDSAVDAVLRSSPARVPVVMGPCGAGRTSLLGRLRDRLEPASCQFVALDRAVSTPERLLAELLAASPFQWSRPATTPDGPQEAYAWILSYLTRARTASGEPATFLLDEFLEVKTFDSFPGLRHVVGQTVEALAGSENRFVLTTRFVGRMLDALREAPDRFAVLHVPALTTPDVAADLLHLQGFRSDEAEDTARVVVALTAGRPAYVAEVLRTLADPMLRVQDPVSAFAALLSPGGAICDRCRLSYEFRLHRARGYGALKAILAVLAEDEFINLTEIAQRMQRTPGSTKDYLGWLEDVDLVACQRKRYSMTDPVLRLWVRLHTQCDAPHETRVAELVQRYAVTRLSGTDLPA